MSNFQTFGAITEGLQGSAPAKFVASTIDSFAQLIAPGYLNDKKAIVKANDLIEVNYLDASTFPVNVGEASIYAAFLVQYDPTLQNWNMIPRSASVPALAAYGVHSGVYDYAGGSASFSFSDPALSQNSVVLARWQSSANPSIMKTVLPGNGTLAVVASADPGVSVLEYISVLPSVALQNQGVFAAQYSNAGGSATITIANPNITANMVVMANFASQANAAEIKTVLAGAGTITIVATANPGVSVIEYLAVLPSSALTTLGFYGAQYTNAGGSATTTITDANILTSSIVVADWASQANAVEIEKVTPGAGSLTILSSGDPGASVLNYSATPAEGAEAGQFLLSANNLSDVQSASASLANLGGVPLAGGQMTGQLLLDRGTATSTAGAATINHQLGVVTTEALTTAGAAAYSFTYTNSRIAATSGLFVQLQGGTNTIRGIEIKAVPGSGSATLSFFNNNVAGSALNGTLIFSVLVI